jgi:Sulfotransferase domain
LDNFKIYRYEDVIFDKQRWVSEMATFLHVDLSSKDVSNIVDTFDYVPEREDIYKHIRQVKPGNYKSHLTREAIDYIQDRYTAYFEQFGYH